MLSNYRSETFCVGFVTIFCCFFFSSQYQKFRCTWINSLFKIGWFLLEFFCCFCQNRQRQGYQVFLMVYYCQFAVKIGQIVSKNATLLKMETTLLVINFSVWKYCSSSKQLTRNWWPWHLKSNKDKSWNFLNSFSFTWKIQTI